MLDFDQDDDVTVTDGPAPARRDIRRTGLHPDYWYPVARSSELARGKTYAARFAGAEIVLVRPEQGAVFALEDRCAHRQVPLSRGVVEGERIKCGYHCWTFDRAGACVGVPYYKKGMERPRGVRAYPTREAHGLIWVFPGDPALAEAAAFPQLTSCSDAAYKTRFLDREIGCHYSFMHENLMDMNHQFLHRRLMGGIKTICLDARSGPGWAEVDYSFGRDSGKQPLGEALIIGRHGVKTADQVKDFMTIRTEYPYQSLKFYTDGGAVPALDLWNCYIPLDAEQRSNRTFGLLSVRRPPIPFLLDVFWPAIVWFTNAIFTEDRWIVELEQAAFDRQGADANLEIFPAIRNLRQVLVEGGVALPA